MRNECVLRGGTIVDGTGSPGFRADLGLRGERIASVARTGTGRLAGVREIDVNGMVVAPGFIDIHSHHDLYLVDQDPVLRFGPYLAQGVTTCVVGNCGWSMAPCLPETKRMLLELVRSMSVPVEGFPWESMDEYLSFLDEQDLPCNLAQLVGHGALRIAAMGERNHFAGEAEIERMKVLLRSSLDAGCVGLSTGLMYYPGMYAHTDELIELARVAAEYERPYASHLRGYCATLPEAVGEALEVAVRSGVRLQISHLHAVPFFGKAARAANAAVELAEWLNSRIPLPALPSPTMRRALAAIDRALDRDHHIGMDVVPYTLGNTTVTVLFPPWANRGGRKQLLRRLGNSETRARIRRDMGAPRPRWPHWDAASWSDPYVRALGWGPIRVLSVRGDDNRQLTGKNFIEIGREWHMDPFDALCRLTLEEDAEVAFTFGYPARPWVEKVVSQVLLHPRASVGADTILSADGTSPPAAFGCFPRVLGHYVRELGVLNMEEAVWKMTGLAAETYGLDGRGTLEPGSFADIVVFDPRTVGERCDDQGRPSYARGIHYVFVNGTPVVYEGRPMLEHRPGRILRKH